MGRVESLYTSVFVGLFVCWLLPVGVLAGLMLLGSSLRVMWRSRGLEPDGLYCWRCRFALQGCASWNCPECGAHLDDGRVLTTGPPPPMGLVSRMLLMSLLLAGPLVLLGVVGVTVWPGNYQVDRTLVLTPSVDRVYAELRLDGRGESLWFRRGRPEVVRLNSPWIDFSPTRHIQIRERYKTPLPASDSDLVPDALWGRIEQVGGLEEQAALWREGARAEFVAWLRYAAAEGARPDGKVGHFRVHEDKRQHFEPGPWPVVVEALLALAAWFYVMRRTVRWHDAVHAAYARQIQERARQLVAEIEVNRERAGLGGSTGRGVGPDV